MKVTIYYPDGTNAVYTVGSSGVTEITPNSNKTSVSIKNINPALNVTISNFPMIIAQA